jgi:hypothetical protein
LLNRRITDLKGGHDLQVVLFLALKPLPSFRELLANKLIFLDPQGFIFRKFCLFMLHYLFQLTDLVRNVQLVPLLVDQVGARGYIRSKGATSGIYEGP